MSSQENDRYNPRMIQGFIGQDAQSDPALRRGDFRVIRRVGSSQEWRDRSVCTEQESARVRSDESFAGCCPGNSPDGTAWPVHGLRTERPGWDRPHWWPVVWPQAEILAESSNATCCNEWSLISVYGFQDCAWRTCLSNQCLASESCTASYVM